MLAYYHTGTAAKAADHEDQYFWDYLQSIYPTAPRASERRHFRGKLGLQTLNVMEKFSPNPSQFFDQFERTYRGVRQTCESELPNFGPYFQLKICDYMDRCLDKRILNYQGLDRNLPSLPAKAVYLMMPDKPIDIDFNLICKQTYMFGIMAPPLFDRGLCPAEVETLLCDWKRAKTGSSWLGADVLDKRNALIGYGEKAEHMIDMMPPNTPRDRFELAL
jgi:hypothetical protein